MAGSCQKTFRGGLIMAKVYQEMARLVVAIENCKKSGNTEWEEKHGDKISEMMTKYLPHGSGIDNGVNLSEKTNANRLVFIVEFHCMDEMGGYCGWRSYTLTIKPDLSFGFTIHITGNDFHGLKDYLADIFDSALNKEVE